MTRHGVSSGEPENNILDDGLAVKYDMCWQKRGSGRSYNSPSGVGSVIGQHTGKVLQFGICSNHCRFCSVAEQMNKEPVTHTCPKNWSNSSKAMEAYTGAHLLQEIENSTGIKISQLIMDDDSATLSRVQQTLGHQVDKISDINHSKRSLGNAMYNSLQRKHKSLSNGIIKYFQRSFTYAVQQNKNDEEIKKGLGAVVPNAFGDHSKCGIWCRADDEGYRHRSLPNGKDLSDIELYEDLIVIFDTLGNNSHKLAPAGSTKDVESLNNIYASKAPKRICYSSSESLSNRVNASVSQKNLGYDYITTVSIEAGLSPSKITSKFCDSLEKQRKRQLQYSRNPEVKRRRLAVDTGKASTLIKNETKEGTTYQSNVGLTLVGECKEIPIIRYRPELTEITDIQSQCVVFDLETGSLQEDADMLQIAAKSATAEFSCYIQPSKPIAKAAGLVTGLSSAGGMLFHNGNRSECDYCFDMTCG